MNTPDTQSREVSGASETGAPIEPLYIHLTITDPEVLAAVSEYPPGPLRKDFVDTCLKVGVLSLRAAKGVIDGDAIRSAGDHLIGQLNERLVGYRTLLEENVTGTLSHYFDPANGLFHAHVQNLTKEDGDLARAIQCQLDSGRESLHKMLDGFLGENSALLSLLDPKGADGVLAAMRTTVDEIAQAEQKVILGQFSLDDPNSALSRLIRELKGSHSSLFEALDGRINNVVGEFSLDREDSALSRLVKQVETAQQSISKEFSLDSSDSALSRFQRTVQEQLGTMAASQHEFQGKVIDLLSSLNARRAAEARSTDHGFQFEDSVGNQLRLLANPAGDIVESCGTTTGTIRNSRVGDFVVILSPESAAAGARIVVEAKESASYSLKATLDEADEARRNRGAACCLFIHSAKTAPAGMDTLSRFGQDVIVIWDPDDPATDIVFKAAFQTVKALSVRAAQHSKADAASFQAIDKAIEAIRKQINGFDELNTTSETIKNGALKMLDRVRIMRTDIERQIGILSEHTSALRTTAGEGDLSS